MRFADKRYYVEAYVKCANCGVLVYDQDVTPNVADTKLPPGTVLCSDWCVDWFSSRQQEEASSADA